MVRDRTPRWAAAAAISYFITVNLVILMAMVIAPHGSPEQQAEAAYKLTNLAIAALALIVAIWRGWYAFLIALATLQFGSLFLFAHYVNSLPR